MSVPVNLPVPRMPGLFGFYVTCYVPSQVFMCVGVAFVLILCALARVAENARQFVIQALGELPLHYELTAPGLAVFDAEYDRASRVAHARQCVGDVG